MKLFHRVLFLCLVFPSASLAGFAQTQPSPALPAASPVQANEKDVDTIDHIIAATHDVISGPAGPRDWNRFRSLFYQDARLIPSFRDQNGKLQARASTQDEYAQRAGDYFGKEGFFETALANRIEVWDRIAHVWSTYESRHAKGDQPFARGINSFQLFYDGTRWWIITIYWEGEEAGHPLPEKYLK